MKDYEKQANQFLKKTGVSFQAEFKKYDIYFEGDKEKRDIYNITLKRGNRSFSFDFGQSLENSGLKIVNKNTGNDSFVVNTDDYMKLTKNGSDHKMLKHKLNYYYNNNIKTPHRIESFEKLIKPVPPTTYDVLSCLQKYDVGTLENFCDDFGYDIDSMQANKVYKAVCIEFKNIQIIWTDTEIEQLQEIQ